MSVGPHEVAWLIKTPKGLYRCSKSEVSEAFKMGIESKANVLIRRETDELWSKPADVRHLFFDSEFLIELERPTLPVGFGQLAPSLPKQAKPVFSPKQLNKSLLTRNDRGEYECDTCGQGILERVTLSPFASPTGWGGILAILLAITAVIVGIKAFTATSGLTDTAQELRDEAHLVLVRGGVREDLTERVLSGSTDLGRDFELLTVSMQRVVDDAAEFVAEAHAVESSLFWGRTKAIVLLLVAVGLLLFARITIVSTRILRCTKCNRSVKDY